MSHSMCDTGEWVYVFGGMDEKRKVLNSVERIKVTPEGTISSDAKWESVGQMHQAAANVGLYVMQNGNILVFGGTSLKETFKDVYFFGVK